ncbi:MAG: hypothetical protein ACLS4Z_07490 [Christensenellaceae bacterium]
MPKRSDIKKVLVIGSGPIVIGQAAEFDYAGAQACRVLKNEGINVVLCNSNPATIMTDRAGRRDLSRTPYGGKPQAHHSQGKARQSAGFSRRSDGAYDGL